MIEQNDDRVRLQLAKTNDPILRIPAGPVAPDEIKDLHPIINSMLNILDVTGGIGLAAPQVCIGKSLFVISIDGVRRVFINPQVISTDGDMVTEKEGCLSIPGLQLRVKRPRKVNATWLNEDGVAQTAELDGLWARCWLHEYDHLQGIMIDQRVSKLALDMAARKQAKRKRNQVKG